MLCAIWTTERILILNKTYHVCYQKTVLVPGVCSCIRIRSMMHYVHTGEVVVTSIKIDIFWLVTTRPIAHPGRFACIPNCVGEFGTGTGQPLVTSNVMSNYLSYHHKAYYTYIEMYIQMYNAMCHMDTWENIRSATKPIMFVIKRTVLVQGVCPCIRIRSIMHYVHTG